MKKFSAVLMLVLILTSALNVACSVHSSSAQEDKDRIFADDFVERNDEAILSNNDFAPHRPSGSNTEWQRIFEGKLDAEQEKTIETYDPNSRSGGDRWNFSDTSEWGKFVYMEGNKTRLVVGVNSEDAEGLHELEKLVAKRQGEIVNTISMGGNIRAVVVELPLTLVTAFAEETRIMELVSYIEPNMKVQAQLVPNDPNWGLQWGPQKIEADWAWNTTLGSQDVLVAVVDTGIDYTHPDLAENYVPLGYDWVSMDADPLDDFGHGTHCAGIIAATINNGIGIAGLAQVRIMAEKVLGSGGGGYDDWVANGIVHATDSGARIISMSLGGYGESELLHEAVRYAYDSGVLVVAAAGNDDTNMKFYPAGYDESVAVAATDEYDNKASFSNWGDWIELAAPGVNVYSTMPTYHVTMNDWGYSMNYAYMSGTSMACPHVAGLAALVWSLYPNKVKDWVRLWLRYTADDVGDPSFDVYYGYGRINARRTVEQAPPAHELIAYEWTTPPYVEPAASGIMNATVLNFGENNETSVMIHLIANDTLVDSASIDFFASGDSTRVSLSWNPMVEGLYNVTLYAVPVPGETSIANNVLWKRIYVGFPVKAAVLHSAGNIIGETIANWQVLNTEWYLFGESIVYVDYATLNKDNIAYEDLANTEADVLIISCAFDPYSGWEFTNSEIEAITRYVKEGHGLIATGGTLNYMVPNNNALAPLFGLDETITWGDTLTDLLHLVNSTHPLFADVPDPLVFPNVATGLPPDGRWGENELEDGTYLALGHYQESAIVVRRGLVYISPWLEIIPPYYHHHLQLLYNAITWSRYQKPQHELAVSLEAPKALKPSRSALLNATVSNMGLTNETDVELQLLVNGAVVNSTSIPELCAEGSYTISHLWTPTAEGTYNITVYAPPGLGEEDIANNVGSVRVLVSALSVALFQNYDPWGYPANQEALDRYGVPYVVFRSGEFGGVDLSAFSKVVIASDQDQTFYNSIDAYRWWFEDYVSNGGTLEVHAADWGSNGGMWIGPLPGGLQRTNYYGQYVTVVDPTHELLTTPNVITDAELDNWNSAVHGYFSAYPVDAHIIIIEDMSRMPAYLEFSYGSGSIIASSQTLEWAYNHRLSLILENSLLYAPIRYEHDLSVRLDAPTSIELGKSTMLTATVRNTGSNNETDVKLHLLINDTLVNNATLPELLVGESHTINYAWTPTRTGSYNITAYAQPEPGEEHVANNIVTKETYIFFYMQLYLPHEWVGGGDPMGWQADDASWQYTLPFDFPFYGIQYRTISISSNGLITLLSPDASLSNSIPFLAQKLAIAAAWDDWVTYDIYVWQNSTHVGIRWGVAAYYNRSVDANFEAILSADGIIQLNYGYNNGPISATAGISNGEGHIIAEDVATLDSINTIVFTPFQPEHDIAVSLEAPVLLIPSNSIALNATVLNQGSSNETNVELQLLINDTVVNFAVISELPTGVSHTITYLWTPTAENAYNITAHAPPVEGETFLENNDVSTVTTVMQPSIRPIEGQYANYTIYYVDHDTGEEIFNRLWNFTYLSYISPHQINITVWMKDPYNNTQSGWMIVNVFTRIVERDNGIGWTGMWYPGWIEKDVATGSTINLLGGNATIEDNKVIYVNGQFIDCWEIELEDYGWRYAFWYDKASGLWIGMRSTSAYDATHVVLTATNVPIGFMYEHDLTVTLDAPKTLPFCASTILNATVYNTGSSNETDVELQLLINSSVVGLAPIPELTTEAFYTLSYLWTPTVEGTYIVTAYAIPVPSEEFTANNIITKLVQVRTVEGHILFDQTHSTDSVTAYSTWVANLIDVGYVIDTLVTSPITSPILEGYDVFVIPQAYNFYSSDELLAIQDFVYNGGGLLVIGDDAPYIYTDLTYFAGIEWGYGGYYGYTSDISPHPVTDGVTTAYFGGPLSKMNVSSPAMGLIRDPYGNIMLAASEKGLGKVLGLADEDSIIDGYIGYVDNLRLANNIIEWLMTRSEIFRDVAVTDVVVPVDQVCQGWLVEIDVTVANLGETSENFTVTVYYDGNTIATQNIQNLEPNATLVVGFMWNTTGVPYWHNYTISAYASPVPYETELTNNRYNDGTVKIRIPGDVKDDDAVNILDCIAASSAFGSTPSDPQWNRFCDLNSDGRINVLDLILMANNFGKHG